VGPAPSCPSPQSVVLPGGLTTLGTPPLPRPRPRYPDPVSILGTLPWRPRGSRDQFTFRWMGKDRSCSRGPSSVCSTLTSSEVESTTRASALRIAIRARVQGPRSRGKGSSSAPPSAPRTTSTSGELARALAALFLTPPSPPRSSHRGPGRALIGPERQAGAEGTWSGLRGLPGAPGQSPQPRSCCSSCRVCRATIWWLMEATKGAGLAIASVGSLARLSEQVEQERGRRGRLESPGSHFLTQILGSESLSVCGQPWPGLQSVTRAGPCIRFKSDGLFFFFF
jgi:hypothetical protein